MSAATVQPAAEAADATGGGAAGETGVEGRGLGGVYICTIMCLWMYNWADTLLTTRKTKPPHRL